jgi:hypothetical protein
MVFEGSQGQPVCMCGMHDSTHYLMGKLIKRHLICESLFHFVTIRICDVRLPFWFLWFASGAQSLRVPIVYTPLGVVPFPLQEIFPTFPI